MNKLISKNPVLRFKEGKKIEKFLGGGFSRKASGRTSNELAGYLLKKIWESGFSRPNREVLNFLKNFNIPSFLSRRESGRTSNELMSYLLKKVFNPFLESNNLTSLLTSFKTPELKGSREAYLKRLELLGFTASPSTITKLSNSSTSIPINNVWLKGYKHDEVKDVKAMLNELIKLGLLKDRFGADGKWGKNTEAAYLTYLNLKNVPTLEKPKTPPVTVIMKQGGQLPSRNIVKRFKNRKFN